MGIREVFVHNSLTGKKEKFSATKAGQVSIYCCGPTVYGYTHVGNARAAVVPDLVVKTLKLAGYTVTFARNITDIDDKIIQGATQEGSNWTDVVKKYTQAYHNDLRSLGIVEPAVEPTATNSINEILNTIKSLIEQEFAYVAETPFGNDVYFRVSKFQGYGKLSKRKLEDMKVGARVEVGESKEDPLDFALWKAAKPSEPTWESPWGPGRPGWHIECSAMIEKVFGNTIDIHMGGLDLLFPHHENEIAQSESCFHRPLANFWIHNGLLNFGKEKMSKSLGNIFTTSRFLEMYGPEVFRMMCLQVHYRSPMEFSEEITLRSESMLERIYHAIASANLVSSLDQDIATQAQVKMGPEYANLNQQITDPLFDDFNTSKGLGIIFKTIRALHKLGDKNSWSILLQILPTLRTVYGIGNEDPQTALAGIRSRKLKRLGITEARAKEIDQLIESRDIARKNKRFEESDSIRNEIEAKGILIMDGPDGSSWTIKGGTQ
jgi:cysteinyl-tRNA synthetase